MKHSIPYLFFTFLVVLLSILLFHRAFQTNLPSNPAQIETSFNERIRSFQKKSDTLNTTISSLKSKNKQIKAKGLLQEKLYAKKIKETEALPADSQLLVFKETTSYTGNVRLKLSVNDTMAEIPLKSIRNANLKFTELEATSIQNLLLKSITENQDSLISNYEQVYLNQKAQIELLTQHDEQLLHLIQQKNKELKKQKTKHRLELAGVGILVVLSVCL
jgi:hypothetical protein